MRVKRDDRVFVRKGARTRQAALLPEDELVDDDFEDDDFESEDDDEDLESDEPDGFDSDDDPEDFDAEAGLLLDDEPRLSLR